MLEFKQVPIYKMNEESVIPKFATQESACFDLHVNLHDVSWIDGYNSENVYIRKSTYKNVTSENFKVEIKPFERLLIPTGLIFALEKYYSLRLHPRSSLSVKNGLTLANCEGVIDSDYVNQLFIPIINLSDVTQVVTHLDRIAQGEIIKNPIIPNFVEIETSPNQKTDRIGGFGSTGK